MARIESAAPKTTEPKAEVKTEVKAESGGAWKPPSFAEMERERQEARQRERDARRDAHVRLACLRPSCAVF